MEISSWPLATVNGSPTNELFVTTCNELFVTVCD